MISSPPCLRADSTEGEAELARGITMLGDVLVDGRREHAETLSCLGQIVGEAAGNARHTVHRLASGFGEFNAESVFVVWRRMVHPSHIAMPPGGSRER
jgi:hypothetical protein